MLTCLVLVVLAVILFVGMGLVVTVFTGLAAIAPIFLGIIGLLVVDYFVLKKLFKKKGGKKGE